MTDQEKLEFTKELAMEIHTKICNKGVSDEDRFDCAINVSSTILGAYLNATIAMSGSLVVEKEIDDFLKMFSDEVKFQLTLFKEKKAKGELK